MILYQLGDFAEKKHWLLISVYGYDIILSNGLFIYFACIVFRVFVYVLTLFLKRVAFFAHFQSVSLSLSLWHTRTLPHQYFIFIRFYQLCFVVAVCAKQDFVPSRFCCCCCYWCCLFLSSVRGIHSFLLCFFFKSFHSNSAVLSHLRDAIFLLPFVKEKLFHKVIIFSNF